MNIRFCFYSLAALLVTSLVEAGPKKNVVLILADDLGWSDTTLYGTTSFYRTPNIQRLAKRGMLFTRAYASSPLCSPTRASILTGLTPAKHGITAPQCHLPEIRLAASASESAGANQKSTNPNSVTRLDPELYTVAEALHDNGYVTSHFGKWHLGAEPYSPLEHGFDVDIPHWHGPGPAGSYVAPWKYPDFDPQTPNEHIEDRMAEEAVKFIEANKSRPFFMNYWMFSVHAPFDAKPVLIEQYRGVADPKNPQRSPTYAAMIESMDDAVGTLLDTLDRLDIANNTIIVFASDNGGNMYSEVDGTVPTSNMPLRGGKATMFEGGVRGPAIVAVPGLVEPGSSSDAIIQSIDFFPTLLELLDIAKKPDQSFDGVSIVPALEGGDIDRDAIFTYFPHNPPVPDWLPPSVSVHSGDWKLIRLFHGGENGDHRWKLFNLSEDIGEKNDLASARPDLVAKLDAKIEAYLNDANAARPLANPKFDPTKYRIEDEGVGKIRNKAKQKPTGKPVLGWQPGGTTKLKAAKSGLQIQSTGGDPYVSRNVTPVVKSGGPFTVRFNARSNGAGFGQVFWKEGSAKVPFAAARSVNFEMNHDDKPHRYEIEISPDGPLAALRIDTGRGPGTILLTEFEVANSAGEIVFRWSR